MRRSRPLVGTLAQGALGKVGAKPSAGGGMPDLAVKRLPKGFQKKAGLKGAAFMKKRGGVL